MSNNTYHKKGTESYCFTIKLPFEVIISYICVQVKQGLPFHCTNMRRECKYIAYALLFSR